MKPGETAPRLMGVVHSGIHCKGPMPPPPKFQVEKDTRKKEHHGGAGIRCPHCSWRPRKQDLWMCHCGCAWHTFDTGGKCPNCGWHWTQTQCTRCTQWAAHAAWYEDGKKQ